MSTNLYDVLGVARETATDEDIKTAYRLKAKRLHPDAGGNVESFQQLSTAHAVLSDPARRARYDKSGEIDDGADNTRRDALKIVHTMMEQVCLQLGDGPIYQDLVATMQRAAQEAITEITGKIEQMRTAVVRAASLAKRFKSKGDTNVLAGMIDAKIAGIEQAIEGASHALDLHKVALEILKEHSFETDAAPAALHGLNNANFANQAYRQFGQFAANPYPWR